MMLQKANDRTNARSFLINGEYGLGLLAVDGLADEGDGLLIDARGVPALNSDEVRLALLVTSAWLPAMSAKEICCRGERVGTRTNHVDMTVAISIRAIADDIARQELRLAHGARPAALQAQTCVQTCCLANGRFN